MCLDLGFTCSMTPFRRDSTPKASPRDIEMTEISASSQEPGPMLVVNGMCGDSTPSRRKSQTVVILACSITEHLCTATKAEAVLLQTWQYTDLFVGLQLLEAQCFVVGIQQA